MIRSGLSAGITLGTLAELAEDLCRAGVIAALQPVAEAGEGDAAIGLDVMPAIARAGPQAERTELAAAIEAEMLVVALARGEPALGVEVAAAVAGDHAEAQRVEHRRIGTDDKAAGRAGEPGGVAVAVGLAPGPVALPPDCEAVGVERRHRPFHALGAIGGEAPARAQSMEGDQIDRAGPTPNRGG